jgi:methyl-accepting chemotaxis protein
MESVNAILNAEVDNINDICNLIASVNEGDFDVQVTELPGDFVIQTKAINALMANLNGVSSEVTDMIESISKKGDLRFKTPAEKYNGDWREIMEGLNNIAEAVDAPIQAWKVCLNEMKMGNFDINEIDRIVKDKGFDADASHYQGIFRDISMDIDHTVSDISSYINEIEDILAKTANGDLRNSISREYVGSFNLIKRSVNHINETLSKTMGEITSASDQVLSGAKQISISAQELANGAQEQASSVEELNASIDMINQQTRKNADNAMEASQISNNSTTTAQEGNESMKEMVSAMSQIKDSSGAISKIIKAIQDIAFQTNLLALNAAVEAARAGEHGKGFAVVAEEVRSLAGRSQESATETTGLIATSNSRVESGADIVEATSASLDMIVKNVSEVSALISNISESSSEQAESISQVSEGLSQISRVTQSNSAVSQQTAAASEEPNSQAELLQQLVAYFKL